MENHSAEGCDKTGGVILMSKNPLSIKYNAISASRKPESNRIAERLKNTHIHTNRK
jgi:hypothetical protein